MPRSTEPAFPAEEVHGDGVQLLKRHLGLTIREEFAKAAMQGILSDLGEKDPSFADVAHRARLQADALIAELAESESEQHS
jgi:hypothetical protein